MKNGPVVDKTGRATAVLKGAVGYEASDAGFSQLISSMEKTGDLTREIRGKRTYRIARSSAAQSTKGPGDHDPGVSPLDYDELAAVLLARVTRVLAKSQASDEPAAWARRRIEQLQGRVDELQRELARAKAEAKASADEREELRGQLEAASHNLSLLTERGTTKNRPGRAAERLGKDEQALLYELRGQRRAAVR
jgi:hypothetical protein